MQYLNDQNDVVSISPFSLCWKNVNIKRTQKDEQKPK